LAEPELAQPSASNRGPALYPPVDVQACAEPSNPGFVSLFAVLGPRQGAQVVPPGTQLKSQGDGLAATQLPLLLHLDGPLTLPMVPLASFVQDAGPQVVVDGG
jgi:hypothetical protein